MVIYADCLNKIAMIFNRRITDLGVVSPRLVILRLNKSELYGRYHLIIIIVIDIIIDDSSVVTYYSFLH